MRKAKEGNYFIVVERANGYVDYDTQKWTKYLGKGKYTLQNTEPKTIEEAKKIVSIMKNLEGFKNVTNFSIVPKEYWYENCKDGEEEYIYKARDAWKTSKGTVKYIEL